jgi:hypothetical protein
MHRLCNDFQPDILRLLALLIDRCLSLRAAIRKCEPTHFLLACCVSCNFWPLKNLLTQLPINWKYTANDHLLFSVMEAQEGGQPKKYSCGKFNDFRTFYNSFSGHEKCGYQTNKLFNFQRHRKIHEKKAQLREIANHSNLARSPPSAIDAPAAKIQRLDVSFFIC